MWGMREVGKLGKHPEIQGTSGEAHWGQKCYWSQRSSGILTSLLSICFQVNSFVNGQGPDPEWGCLVPAAVCRFVTLCKEDLTTQIHLTMRIDWLIDWFKIYLLIMLLQLSTFFLCPPPPSTPIPSSNFPFISYPWVVHRSFLASPFPILFLTSSCLFCAYQCVFLNTCTFPFILPPTPLNW